MINSSIFELLRRQHFQLRQIAMDTMLPWLFPPVALVPTPSLSLLSGNELLLSHFPLQLGIGSLRLT